MSEAIQRTRKTFLTPLSDMHSYSVENNGEASKISDK